MSTAKAKTPDAAERIYAATYSAKLTAAAAGVAFLPADAIAAIRAQLEIEHPKRKLVAGRNLMFDALAEGCGYVGAVTKIAGGQVAKALKDIAEVDPDLTPDELRRIAIAVRRKYDNAGPIGVAAHFHEFSHAGKKTETAKRDLYIEVPGWREKLQRMFPAAQDLGSLVAGKWADLSITLRQELIK